MDNGIRISCQSAGMWGDLGTEDRLLEFLNAATELGYAGVGTFDGHLRAFAERPAALRREMDARGLRLVAVDTLLDERDDASLLRLAAFLERVGCGLLVAIGGQGSGTDAIRRLAERLERIGAATLRHGVTTVYHHHEGTVVATAQEVEELLRCCRYGDRDTRPLALLADSGHIAQDMDVTPAAFIRRHAAHLRLIEFKDYAPERGLGYELGRGRVDFPAVARALRDCRYTGWIMVEQNETALTPRASAAVSRAYLREQLGW